MSVGFGTLDNLLNYIDIVNPDIIVVEGYNGVGKSRVIERLKQYYGVSTYRPNYTGWTNLLPKQYRWSIFASFSDVFHSMHLEDNLEEPMVFDRGFFSGVIYNGISPSYYREIIGDLKVIQVLVTCGEDTYNKLLSVRSSDKPLSYEDCARVTEEYRKAFESAGAEYVEFWNTYDVSIGKVHASTCRGCSHYNIGDSCCKHPAKGNIIVDPSQERCSQSADREVQDLGELQTVSP